MSEPEIANAELHNEIRALRQEVDELRRMLLLIASTVALVEGQNDVSHTYLRRALSELENTSMGSLMEEYMQSETLNADLERGLKIMAEQAEERNLPDLAEHLKK
jgi:paraquat-inducible protein B